MVHLEPYYGFFYLFHLVVIVLGKKLMVIILIIYFWDNFYLNIYNYNSFFKFKNFKFKKDYKGVSWEHLD